MNHKNAGCIFSKAEGFSCSLDVLYGCLGKSKKLKKDNCCSAVFFLKLLVIKTQDPGPDSLKLPDPDSVCPDPQY